MSDKGFQERRKHPRFPVFLNVWIALPGEMKQRPGGGRISGKGRKVSGMTGDISFEGLLIKANPLHDDLSAFFSHTLVKGQGFSVDLEIQLDGKRIRGEGQMRWFKLWYTGQEPYQLEAGVFLQKMDSESRAQWDAYFKKLGS